MANLKQNKLPQNPIDHVTSTRSKGNLCKPHILQLYVINVTKENKQLDRAFKAIATSKRAKIYEVIGPELKLGHTQLDIKLSLKGST
jgi:hypothetical protein